MYARVRKDRLSRKVFEIRHNLAHPEGLLWLIDEHTLVDWMGHRIAALEYLRELSTRWTIVSVACAQWVTGTLLPPTVSALTEHCEYWDSVGQEPSMLSEYVDSIRLVVQRLNRLIYLESSTVVLAGIMQWNQGADGVGGDSGTLHLYGGVTGPLLSHCILSRVGKRVMLESSDPSVEIAVPPVIFKELIELPANIRWDDLHGDDVSIASEVVRPAVCSPELTKWCLSSIFWPEDGNQD